MFSVSNMFTEDLVALKSDFSGVKTLGLVPKVQFPPV